MRCADTDEGSAARSSATTRASRIIAKEAVKSVYQHVSSPRDSEYVPQRVALAERFRREYGSDVAASPTRTRTSSVSSIPWRRSRATTRLRSYAILAFALIALLSGILWFFFSSFWFWFGCLVALTAIVAVVAYVATHIKVAFGLPGYKWWQTLHFTEARMKFYDMQLNPNVGWARHALAIDEHRADFDRVPWGG